MAKDVKHGNHNFVSLDPTGSGAKLSCAELFIIFYYMSSVWLRFNYILLLLSNNYQSQLYKKLSTKLLMITEFKK